jgi:hypothetical protein
MKIASTKRLLFLVTLLVVVAFTATASTIKSTATRKSNDNATTTGVFKALTDSGATAIFFSTTAANSFVRITFNAECGVLGPPQAWVSVTVLVDGIEARPQNNTDFALCTANSTTTYQWVGAVRQSFINVGPGTHKVQIRVDLLNGATRWWLGDTSLATETQP